MLIFVLFLGVSPCLCWDALWRCLGLFRDLAAFVTFRTFLDFLKQVLACVTHVTGFIEKIFTFICHGASNDNSLSQFQLFAEATKRGKKQKVWKTHCKQNSCLIGVGWGKVGWGGSPLLQFSIPLGWHDEYTRWERARKDSQIKLLHVPVKLKKYLDANKPVLGTEIEITQINVGST